MIGRSTTDSGKTQTLSTTSPALYITGTVAWLFAAGIGYAVYTRAYAVTDSVAFGAMATAVLLALFAWSRRPFEKARPQNPVQRRLQKPSEYPPPYPNGWFCVAPAHEIQRGDVKPVTAFGQQLVVFRDLSGVVAVLDAFCPHLGANLGHGGTVTSRNCLKCPFHGWEFDRDGKCRHVHGTTTIPANSDIRAWHAVETCGAVMVWHHAAGAPPEWELDAVDYVDRGSFYRAGCITSFVNTHCREIPENGADSAHLNVLHKDFVVQLLRATGLTHIWSASWRPHDTHTHKSQIYLTQAFQVAGVPLPGTKIETHIQQIGPGMVSLVLLTPVGRVHVFEYVTPTAPLEQRIVHVAFCSPVVPRLVGRFVLWALDAQFHRDQPIWESKRMATRPTFSKADGPISEFRRWYQRFYCAESMSFADAIAKESMLDW